APQGEGLHLLGSLPSEAQEQPAHHVLTAGIYRPLGDLKRATGDVPGAIDAFEKALAIDPSNTKSFPNEPQYRRLLALTYMRIAGALAVQGALPDARARYQQAADLLQGL